MFRCLTRLTALLTALLATPGLAAPSAPPTPPLGTGDSALVHALNPLLQRPAVRGGLISIVIARLSGGPPVYAMGANTRLHPASNTKLVTSATALIRLGPAYHWATELRAARLTDGVASTLYLIGRGDPSFVSESLWVLVEDAKRSGLRRVTGDLVVDDTFFTKERLAPGFAEKDTDRSYRAASGAMSLNFNSVRIQVRPGEKPGARPRVEVYPNSGYVEVTNTATTTARGRERLTLRASAHGDRTRLTVSGRIPIHHPGLVTRRRIDNPALFAGLAARLFLRRAGVAVEGKVRVARAPPRTVKVARHLSRSLAVLLTDMNKLSNNFMAEQILRTLGAVHGGAGGWDEGRAEITRFLETEVGLHGFTLANGSGLYGDTAFSANDLVKLLRFMARRRPAVPEFAASLSIAGTDGTLRRRLRTEPRGAIRAKTGTLNGVVCVSGYTYFADDTPAVFSILMNHLPGGPWNVRKVQDDLLRAVRAWHPKKAKGRR